MYSAGGREKGGPNVFFRIIIFVTYWDGMLYDRREGKGRKGKERKGKEKRVFSDHHIRNLLGVSAGHTALLDFFTSLPFWFLVSYFLFLVSFFFLSFFLVSFKSCDKDVFIEKYTRLEGRHHTPKRSWICGMSFDVPRLKMECIQQRKKEEKDERRRKQEERKTPLRTSSGTKKLQSLSENGAGSTRLAKANRERDNKVNTNRMGT